jgi:type IV pilus assembly protein PilO
MSYDGGYTPIDEELDVQTYPTVFGLTLTPAVSGVLIAIGGVLLAAYAGAQLLVPAFQTYQERQAAVNAKEAELTQRTNLLQQVDQIRATFATAQAQNTQVRALLPSQQTLDTLLLDLNRLIVQSNAQMLQFTPDAATSSIITDSSLGPELNGKLKRQVTTVAFRGTFGETLEIFRSLDRFQTLLAVQDLTIELPTAEGQAGLPGNLLRSSFKLYAYIPLTPEEAATAQQQAAPPPSEDPETSP